MSGYSSIEWTETTWNPVTGCTKVSPGCKFCYAERMARRLKAMGQPRYRDGFAVTLQPQALEEPYSWKKPRLVFVNSMSDLFHEKVPITYIRQVFKVMNDCPEHQFQILTKRSERLSKVADKLEWSPNIWMGVSVENQDYTFRVDHLRHIPARIKFLSLEPLIGPISKLNLRGIDWVIVGGESGSSARSMKEEWVIRIRDLCLKANVKFFFKQWGGFNKKKNGRTLDNRTWDEMPDTESTPAVRKTIPSVRRSAAV